MVHILDRDKQPEKIGNSHRLHFCVAASGEQGHGVHGAALACWVQGKKVLYAPAWGSDTGSSTRGRGTLGAILTVLGWIDRNVERGAIITIWCDEEEAWRWLPLTLDARIAKRPKHQNHDLFVRIAELLAKDAHYITFLPTDVPDVRKKARSIRATLLKKAQAAKAKKLSSAKRGRTGGGRDE